tara:strand:+ start:146 stop:367 length:222 start_codon:yes stop_codon:yes gene_type:complete
MHEGAVLEMKGVCIMGAIKKDRKKTPLTNEKETRRAIKAAVDKAKEVDQEMEKYRNADRWQEAVRIGKNHEME